MVTESKNPLIAQLLFLRTAGVAISTGKFVVRRVDMHEIEALGIDLIHRLRTALGDDQMAGPAIAGFDRHFSVGRDVFSVVATETAVPALVSDEIRMASPIEVHFREKVLAID